MEINKLVANADGVLMGYINQRIQELDAKLSSCRQELSELSPLENNDRYGAEQLRDYMDHWDELEFDTRGKWQTS